MITDEQQDQAALYALDALTGAERVAFERELAGSPELATLVRDLREAAAGLALTAPAVAPGGGVKARVMAEIAQTEGATGKVVPFEERGAGRGAAAIWLPWAIAAGLAIFCGLLWQDRAQMEKRLAEKPPQPAATPVVVESPQVLVALGPVPDGPAGAQAVVAWEPSRQAGTIKISNLPPAAAGRDYQLWAVDAAHPEPISAGVVRVDANGVAQVRFQPVQAANQVKAFAISLEREGGVPKKEGPILLAGNI